jgi:hypothetical protein
MLSAFRRNPQLPLPFSTRMTVVRLKNGDLFLHSPVAFDTTLAGRLQSMGRIRHLVSPNQFHYAHIGEWSGVFPDAVTWASPGVRARARARGIDVQFKRDLGALAPVEWRDEIEQTVVPGGIFGEIVFFHKVSKTVILADTILNLELGKLRQPGGSRRGSLGCTAPTASCFSGCDLPLLLQRRKTRAAIEKMLSWQPERIILCHGCCFETNGAMVLRRLFAWAL